MCCAISCTQSADMSDPNKEQNMEGWDLLEQYKCYEIYKSLNDEERYWYTIYNAEGDIFSYREIIGYPYIQMVDEYVVEVKLYGGPSTGFYTYYNLKTNAISNEIELVLLYFEGKIARADIADINEKNHLVIEVVDAFNVSEYHKYFQLGEAYAADPLGLIDSIKYIAEKNILEVKYFTGEDYHLESITLTL